MMDGTDRSAWRRGMKRIWWYLGAGALVALGGRLAARRLRSANGRETDGSADATARIRRQYNQMAPQYDRMMALFERWFLDGGRGWVGAQARGDVLEIAVGTGLNLSHYRRDAGITGIDLSSEMVEVARKRASRLGLNAQLAAGDAQALDFPDGSFDTVVSTLSLCTIPDPARALGEVRRVLRPGGRFVALEHVRSPNGFVRLVQRALDPLSVRFACDHLLREPLDLLEPMGFEIERIERSKLGIIERVVARKPAIDGV
jgi:SAM-dependent methyltransferase